MIVSKLEIQYNFKLLLQNTNANRNINIASKTRKDTMGNKSALYEAAIFPIRCILFIPHSNTYTSLLRFFAQNIEYKKANAKALITIKAM